MKNNVITIKAQAKRNAYSILLLGLICLIVSLFLADHYWRQAKLVIMFLNIVSLIIFFIGMIKILEPDTSFYLSKESLKYQHKYGSWQLPWADIAYVSNVKEAVGIEHQALPYKEHITAFSKSAYS